MELAFSVNKQGAGLTSAADVRPSRRKANGPATAAQLIQMASEILMASPTLRHKLNISLSDLAAADKVRKGLIKK